MKITIFGLTVSSSWGNGHATLWRGLISAWTAAGHRVIFFERDLPYYAAHRDLTEIPGGKLALYSDWSQVREEAKRELSDSDVGVITSYCPDALDAGELLLSSPAPGKIFYDLDTPVTLGELEKGHSVGYIGPRGLGDFDLVLNFTGGEALSAMRERLGARRVAPLYGSVSPEIYQPAAPAERYRAELSYLGTYSDDRQERLRQLFIEPAKRLPQQRFIVGGAKYPPEFPWLDNIYFVRHLPPGEHAAFYASSRLTLNVTRKAMAEMGYCPSGRLFEATACGAAVISDWWPGLECFFSQGTEILIARGPDDVIEALSMDAGELARIGAAARERTLSEYSAAHRAREFEDLVASHLNGNWAEETQSKRVAACEGRTVSAEGKAALV